MSINKEIKMKELNAKEIKQVQGGAAPIALWILRAIVLEYATTVKHAH